MLRLSDKEGRPLEGTASGYHCHAFDIDRPNNDNLNVVENILMGGDLSICQRSEVRLFLKTKDI
jgi:hypothetical protein